MAERRACFIYFSVASPRFVVPALIAGLIWAVSGFRLLMKHALVGRTGAAWQAVDAAQE